MGSLMIYKKSFHKVLTRAALCDTITVLGVVLYHTAAQLKAFAIRCCKGFSHTAILIFKP